MQDLTYITDLVNMNGCKAFTPPRFIRCSTKNIMGKKKFYNATEPGNKSSRFITFEEWNPKVFLKIFKTETNILLTNATSLVQHQNLKSTWIPSSVRSEAVYSFHNCLIHFNVCCCHCSVRRCIHLAAISLSTLNKSTKISM